MKFILFKCFWAVDLLEWSVEMSIFDGLPVSQAKAVSPFHSSQIVAAYLHDQVVWNIWSFLHCGKSEIVLVADYFCNLHRNDLKAVIDTTGNAL